MSDLIGEAGKPVVIEKARVNKGVDLLEFSLHVPAGYLDRVRGASKIVGVQDGRLAEHVDGMLAVLIGVFSRRVWWALFPLPATAEKDSHGVLADALTNEPKPAE